MTLVVMEKGSTQPFATFPTGRDVITWLRKKSNPDDFVIWNVLEEPLPELWGPASSDRTAILNAIRIEEDNNAAWRSSDVSYGLGLVFQNHAGVQMPCVILLPDGMFVDGRQVRAGDCGETWRVITIAEWEKHNQWLAGGER